MTNGCPAARQNSPKPVLSLQPFDERLGDDSMPGSKEETARIGKRLAALRKERGCTQVQLAEALGIMQSKVSDYEHGRLRLHGELIQKIAQALAVSADELLGVGEFGKKKMNGAAPQRATRSKRLRERLEQIEALPKRDRDALMRTINNYLANVS